MKNINDTHLGASVRSLSHTILYSIVGYSDMCVCVFVMSFKQNPPQFPGGFGHAPFFPPHKRLD